ncbi:tonB-system energizer ExbB [Morganella morganii]|uniref:tonB-system energizer ExbB n=1 Tax=Morganella morganii TaxID=582 RepID=UPI001164012A|nr:tonB-system energizer ExbB [Morganella morganii]QQO73035.1 tonB-system energizer ExbB [Morganella morganii]
MRNLTVSVLLALCLTGSAFADNTAAVTPATTTPVTTPAATAGQPEQPAVPVSATEVPVQEISAAPADGNRGFAAELSVISMYQGADVIVKSVMIGLIIASVITWSIFFAKGADLIASRRRIRREAAAIKDARSLDEAAVIADTFGKKSVTRMLVLDAVNERTASEKSRDLSGIKDRVTFRQERIVAGVARHMGRGNGYLATIGAISPFVGLFGTVWGIMNSFIGIAHSQTTNLAVVAPGIAEALLATALGLVAAIPAVVIYNIFARMISAYRGDLGDTAAHTILWLGRDLDLADSKAG